jgi:hypothetical protein
MENDKLREGMAFMMPRDVEDDQKKIGKTPGR